MSTEANTVAGTLSPLVGLLRCLECGSALEIRELVPGSHPQLGPDGALGCTGCPKTYPVVAGTVRMVGDATSAEAAVKQQTADSFAYEWEQFGTHREEWRKNFLDYVQPHTADFFEGRLVLDVGAGSGRHSRQAADLGADVVAADLGDSIDVARGNLPADALTVQADAEELPLAPESFDLVMSIGVLHHLPDPERGFRSIVRHVKPGGWVQIYVYWKGREAWHRWLLTAITQIRKLTTRMPHRLLHALCYPLAAVLFALFVIPNRVMRRVPFLRSLAARLPLQTYADYPFGVCVNDQFDRFAAPIENRYTAEEVRRWLTDAGLDDVRVLPNHGWVASGRRPGPAAG
jgi:SAM-dependent methyltransferase